MHFVSTHIIYLCAVCMFATAASILSKEIEDTEKSHLQVIKPVGQDINVFANRNSNFPDEEWDTNKNNTDSDLPEVIFDLYNSIYYQNGSLFKNNCDTIRISLNNEINNSSDIFKFKLEKIKSNEKIIDAELYIYRHPNEYYNNSESIVVRIYQILPSTLDEKQLINPLNPDLHKLMNVIYIPTKTYGWQVFKVRSAVENWMKGEDNLGFLITATDSKENRIRPKFITERAVNGFYQTILIMYLEGNNKFQCENDQTVQVNSKKNDNECSIRAKTINFKNLGWDNIIIYPKQIKINECKGNCTTLSRTTFTLHGYLFYSTLLGSNTKSSCCVPTSFYSLPIMFYSRFGNIVIKMYKDVIAQTCGCR